jgi:hypothetical protein
MTNQESAYNEVERLVIDFIWWPSKSETAAQRLDLEAEKAGKKIKRLPVSRHLFD